MWRISSYIEIHTQSECLHSPLHTYPHPYIQHVNTNVVSVLGSSLKFVYYQMMMKYLICITPEKTVVGNDSSDALWNGTVT